MNKRFNSDTYPQFPINLAMPGIVDFGSKQTLKIVMLI